MFVAKIGIQVTRFDAREFGQIIDNLLLCRYIIIDKWYAFIGSIPKFKLKI